MEWADKSRSIVSDTVEWCRLKGSESLRHNCTYVELLLSFVVLSWLHLLVAIRQGLGQPGLVRSYIYTGNDSIKTPLQMLSTQPLAQSSADRDI